MLSERQQRVISALVDRAPRLVAVYRTAVRELNREAEDGFASSRVSVICHCMRELMMGLLEDLTDNPIERVKPTSGSQLERLPNLLAKHPDLDLGLEQDIVPVPRAVAQALRSLISTVAKEQGRNLSNATDLVTKGGDKQHPAVKQWRETYRFFVRWAHIDSHKGDRELPTDDELLARVNVVEDVIEVRTADFFPNWTVVQDLLATINEPLEEDV